MLLQYLACSTKLLTASLTRPSGPCAGQHEELHELPIKWVPRIQPRRFGKVLPGEIGACRQVRPKPHQIFFFTTSLMAAGTLKSLMQHLVNTQHAVKATLCMPEY